GLDETMSLATKYQWYIFGSISLSILGLISCKKEEIPIGTYTGQFWGVNYSSGAEQHYELNLKLELTDITENTFVFSDSLIFDRSADSIFGTLEIPNSNYLIHPYLVGKYEFQKKEFFFSGNYAAAK